MRACSISESKIGERFTFMLEEADGSRMDGMAESFRIIDASSCFTDVLPDLLVYRDEEYIYHYQPHMLRTTKYTFFFFTQTIFTSAAHLTRMATLSHSPRIPMTRGFVSELELEFRAPRSRSSCVYFASSSNAWGRCCSRVHCHPELQALPLCSSFVFWF
jgi:hypothetical protein